jgi:hypothetical protein
MVKILSISNAPIVAKHFLSCRAKIQLLVPVLTIAAGIALIVMGHPLAGIALAGLGIAIGSANGTWDSIGSLIAGVIKGIWTVFSATFSKIMELMGKVR